ncbi:coiled-coil-helix-coiled-coil-helix domain-containing protein 5-like [Patiria miniata]|uniref:IMS import disulfide relay-system CHCH-CHCH-like Cx9C domain-containing protein n=1 Tax=Patiria miniata TaxID=46514 RepID=A0A913Z1Q6_PATMI|nr:coiled-coil-helix-coiled-coil-helix domain-containing protein 5-like [Patiria miniata]XP_038045610.1 coiled-coil-helix-coiled-coil-helix domain-containing protein 5-like [Patiria miniata]XP_038045611.1 coiled-coil-helix-coiled-coil-helix domain-containing protein 5-like [Patiria miniata]XP_038045612.1 coiled-coil-helix-coiled-coil-helix domain-containing protein 5-like [Patiria miniata]
MEAVITLIMKYCGTELDLYGQCVNDHPKDWQTACAELKEKASNCSDHHPVVRQINRDCAVEFSNYDTCLKKNPEDVTVCVDQLHKFLKCADTSAHRIQNAIFEQSKQDGSHTS